MRITKPRVRRTGVAVAVAGVAVVGFAIPALAAAFANGGFEESTTTSNATPYCADGTEQGSDLGGGWTVTADCIDVHHNDGSIDAYEGLKHLDMSHLPGDEGAVSQTFDTVAGTDYIVTFAYGKNWGCADTAASLDVSVTGQESPHTDTIDAPADVTGDPQWTTDGYFFRATGTSATVTFTQTTVGTGCGVLLDDVRVILDPDLPLVDPRVAAGAGAAALGGLAVFRLRRRSQAAA